MPAVMGRAAGFIAELYYVLAVITDKSEANLEAALLQLTALSMWLL